MNRMLMKYYLDEGTTKRSNGEFKKRISGPYFVQILGSYWNETNEKDAQKYVYEMHGQYACQLKMKSFEKEKR